MKPGSLEYVLRSGFDYFMSEVYTSFPCIVLTVHNNLADQRVDVQPIINRKAEDGTVQPRPPILSVPLMFPSSQTSAFTFPVKVGDTVLCVFSQRSIDAFKASKDGTPCDPTDYRRFHERDAVAIPGLYPFQKAVNNPKKRTLAHSTNDTVITHNIGTDNECEFRLKSNGDIKIISPGAVTVECSEAFVNADSIELNATSTVINSDVEINGNVETVGTLENNGVNVGSTHVHPINSGSSAPGPTGTPQ